MQFLQRKVYNQVEKHLDKPEISLILGPRQSGKTTLMKQIQAGLENEGVGTVFFNLDIIEEKQFFQTQHTLLNEANKRLNRQDSKVIFIDEIQRLENAGLFLKGFFDMQTGYKLIVSGSGSLELKANIVEPLTGRKRVFHLLPLSLTEFAAYKLGVDFNKVGNELDSNAYERERLISEYTTYGGYPRVVLAQSHQEKIEVLDEIFSSYLEKDIQMISGVEKEVAFQKLFKLLAHQVGNIINKAELSNNLGIDARTVDKYLNLLEKTFVISLISPYFSNARNETKKNPKVYFLDLGMLSLAKNIQPGAENLIDGGKFENACFLRLMELELFEKIKFWRTKTGTEVDFILTSDEGKIIPLEAKLSAKTGKAGKNLISFIKKYKSPKAFIYTKDTGAVFEKVGVNVEILPYYKLPQL